MREPKPVIRAEVTEKNRTVRIIAAIVLLVIGAVAITSGIMSLLNKDTGWQTVEISPQERSCSESFILQYNFAGSGAEASAVNKKLEAAYAQAAVKAYQLFTPDEEVPGVNNAYYVNHHPNEEITVDPVLYEAFAKLEGTRYLFMGPIYTHYTGLILNASQEYAAQLDPAQDTDSAALMQTLAEFANDPQTVNLELLGDNRIKLSVSDAYLAFLEEEEIEPTFLDFSYMTNAFIIDYLAEVLRSQDLTDGYLVSVDGYTRNLCQDGTFYDGNDPWPFSPYDGSQIWESLARKHENVKLVVCGHDSCAQVVKQEFTGDNGNTVTALLVDGQHIESTDGASGLIAILHFSEDGKNVTLEYYSPVKDQFFLTENQFSFTLDTV